MTDFLRLLVEIIHYIWLFRIVKEWETGGYYINGRFKGTRGPGCYMVFPFFVEMIAVPTIPYMLTTPRMDITLHDRKNLTLWATAWAQVVDYDLAVNSVEDHEHTTAEDVQSIIADRLAKTDSAKLEPEDRAELLRNLTKWCNAETMKYGVKIEKVRFTTFVLDARTYRLIQ